MKALTVRQPWASLIVAGGKSVENRTWQTNYRGRLIIHAGAKVDRAAMAEHGHLVEAYPAGAIIGTVRLVDCVRDSASPWAEAGAWHWVLADAEPCEPISCRGRLGLWSPPSAA
ncbi:MAG TPA: ASCH domain-containing protein [Acidimicrobiales bacterium]|nr:ASCH domain-containing protein [Acidimicrobiales bacterium]